MANNTLMISEATDAISIVNPIILKIIVAVLVFLMGFIIGKVVQRIIMKIFEMSDLDRFLRKKTGMKVKFSVITATIVSYFIYLVSIVMALNRLNIAATVITTVVTVIIVVLLSFLVFGLNDMFANLFAGLFVRFRKNINPGDYIRIKDKRIEGYVVSINAFNIRLETHKDESVFIPNMALFKSEIIKPKKKP